MSAQKFIDVFPSVPGALLAAGVTAAEELLCAPPTGRLLSHLGLVLVTLASTLESPAQGVNNTIANGLNEQYNAFLLTADPRRGVRASRADGPQVWRDCIYHHLLPSIAYCGVPPQTYSELFERVQQGSAVIDPSRLRVPVRTALGGISRQLHNYSLGV